MPPAAPEPAARWRLFLALPVPAAVGARLWQALAPLRVRHSDVRWTPTEQYHLTLVFLGSREASLVDRIVAASAGVAAGWAPFEVGTGEAGGIGGGRRGGVAWLRLAAGREAVARLSLELDAALDSAIYDASAHPRPHLTLGRRIDDGVLADLRAEQDRLRIGWRTDSVVLYRSHTDAAGSRYEALAELPLGG